MTENIPISTGITGVTNPLKRGLPARRTLNALARAILALFLGWLAQGQLQQDHLWVGLLLYAAAIPLFAAQFVRLHPASTAPENEQKVSRPVPGPVEPVAASGAGTGWLPLRWAPVVFAGLLSLASLLLFLSNDNDVAWPVYIGSLLALVVGSWLIDGNEYGNFSPDETAGYRPQSTYRQLLDFWLLIIIAIALFLRLFHFASLPFGTWYDEAVAGIDARRILQDPTFRPVFWESMNHPAQHLYLFALALRLLGDNILSLRAVSVLFGVGTVVAAYLFGREYRGRRWGLLLAFLVATMRWDVNFSRIAMNSIDVPFFIFLTLYFAVRTARTRLRSFRPLIGVGLSLGIGLCFYTAFRLFAIAFVLFAVALGLWMRHRRNREPEGSPAGTACGQTRPASYWLARLGLLALAVWIAVMPVAQFAIIHNQVFWQRTETVSIFTNRDEPNLVRALVNNAQKHLLLFNYRGDNNGRHNIPGAPLLDKLSAVLFALGLGVALARRDKGSLFFLVLFPFGLAAGVLSLDFEAPQSLRSIAALPPVVYFIALSLDSLWTEWLWAAKIKRPRYSLIPAVLLLGAIAVSNGLAYFGRQAQDVGVWQAFSTTETLVGKDVAANGPEPIYYFSQLFYEHPSIRFLAPADPANNNRRILRLPDPLPIREPATRPVVLYIHPDEAWIVDMAKRFYPQATYDTLPTDHRLPPAVYVVRLSPQDVASVQGLDVKYWPGQDTSGTPASVGHTRAVDTSWPAASPLALPFVAQWTGVLYAPRYGEYSLSLEAPDRLELALDGEVLTATRTLTLTRTLAQGNHGLQILAQGAQGPVRLRWQPPGEEPAVVPSWALFRTPVAANGLVGRYYANADWEGEPALERVDPELNVYFHLTPLPRPYCVSWSG